MIETYVSWCAALLEDFTLGSGLGAVLGLSCLYSSCLAIYRLWLSPLSRYPGPKLAALTQWVETDHELKGDGGQFVFKIDEWHEKYGPFVRISPHEVHIQDSEFYESFYASTYVADRRTALSHRFGIPMASHFTSDHHLHRKRRAAMNPMFSKRKAAAFSGSVQATMDRVCDIVESKYSGTGNALNLNGMWVAQYALGYSFGFVDTDGFDSPFVTGMANLLEPLHVITQFPWIGKAMMQLPDWLSIKLNPAMEAVVQFKANVTDQVRARKKAAERPHDLKTEGPDTLLSTVLQSNLPPAELTLERLREESIGVVAAGVETIYRALTVGSHHILADSSILQSLESELKAAIPDSSQMPSYEVLTKLPYLSACVKEVERVGIGTTQRSPRVFRRTLPPHSENPLVLNEAFSMSIRDVHFDSAIFPDPYEFRPERWLPADFVPDGRPVEQLFQPRAPSGKLLSRYLVPFARGPRNCVGMHLAEVEIFVGIATLTRRFAGKMALDDGVGPDSVGIWMDRFVPREKPGAEKVRAIIGAKKHSVPHIPQ